MRVIVAILVFMVSALVADRVDDNGLHGTTAAWIMGIGTVIAVVTAAVQWM